MGATSRENFLKAWVEDSEVGFDGVKSGTRTEYGHLEAGNSREEAAILISKALVELIEIPDVQRVFRKYKIRFHYTRPAEVGKL